MQPIFITGIGTGIGKTLISAILVEKLQADYWKPIQSGDLDDSDSLKIKSLISNKNTVIHPEAYKLSQPLSPHRSAIIDGIEIDLNSIQIPTSNKQLLIEGAGGLMVPLNNEQLIVDLIQHLNASVVLVSENYLGSINHTLLSCELLSNRNIPLKGIIFNGESNPSNEEYILNYTKAKCLGSIRRQTSIDRQTIIALGNDITI